MTGKEVEKLISERDETEVRITLMEGNQMRVYAIQDAMFVPYIDCIIPTDNKLIDALSKLPTVDELNVYTEEL